jgi:hypothetical protein
VRNVEVNLEIPHGKKLVRISQHSPEEQDMQSLPATLENGRLTFTVPRLKTYVVAAIQLE